MPNVIHIYMHLTYPNLMDTQSAHRAYIERISRHMFSTNIKYMRTAGQIPWAEEYVPSTLGVYQAGCTQKAHMKCASNLLAHTKRISGIYKKYMELSREHGARQRKVPYNV